MFVCEKLTTKPNKKSITQHSHLPPFVDPKIIPYDSIPFVITLECTPKEPLFSWNLLQKQITFTINFQKLYNLIIKKNFLL